MNRTEHLFGPANLRAGEEQIAILEHLLELIVHVVVIHRHEQRVGHDAQRDEKLHLQIRRLVWIGRLN